MNDTRMDRILDAALAQYGEVAPLYGLEERVLGRLRGERVRRWRPWISAAAAAATLVLLILSMQSPKPASRQEAVRTRPEVIAAPLPEPRIAERRAMPPANPKPRVAAARGEAAEATTAALPKRDVFPTPTPPTEQELLLAKYMRVTPRREVLAQIRREPLQFHEDPWSAPGTTVSPQSQEPMK